MAIFNSYVSLPEGKFISTLVKFFTSFMGFMAFGGKFIGFESRSHTFCEARCMTTQGTFGFISASSFAGFVPSSVGCLRRSSKDRSRVLPKFSTATLDMLLLQLGWWLQLLRENISWTSSSSSQSYGCKNGCKSRICETTNLKMSLP